MVGTGGGTQAYWVLHEAEESQDDWEHRMRWVTAALDADPAVCKWQQKLRLPGFVNRKAKYADNPPTATLVVCEPERRYSWRDIAPKTFPEPAAPEPVAAVERKQRPDGVVFPGDDYNAREPWEKVVPPGWVCTKSRGEFRTWSMDRRHKRKTATQTDGWLYVWDSDCRELPSGKALSKFAVFAHLHHGGDFGAAGAALYSLGFGTRRENLPEPPPVRVESLEPAAVVSMDDLRGTLRDHLQTVVATRPRLAVVTSGTSVGKSFWAVELLAPAFDRVVWNVATHEAATAMVERLQDAGHTDAAAYPAVNENTCAGWTTADAQRLAEQHGFERPAHAMERAIRVGVPMLACSRCPLSGLARQPVAATPDTALAQFAPVDDAATLAEFADPWADGGADGPTPPEAGEADGCVCPVRLQIRAWERSRHPVQCQERTRRNPLAIVPALGETVAVVTDEHATNNTTPHDIVSARDLLAVSESIRAAADNERNRAAKMRFSEARERVHEVAVWGSRVADVAERLAGHLDTMAAGGVAGATPLPWFAVDTLAAPKGPNRKLAELLARAELPKAFSQPAFELVRRAAMGQVGDMPGEHATVFVSVDGGGNHFAHVHRSWVLAFNPGVCHVILDAHADVDGIRNAFPDAQVFAPPGDAPRLKDARQWWKEINPNTHPAVVVETIEAALNWSGWKRPALLISKRHRRVLFPQTRPTRGGAPVDKPADVEAIANWNAGKRAIEGGTTPQRMDAARAIAGRVEAIRARLARDEHGNAFVEHLRGTKSRGSNKFIHDTDGLLVVGHTRCNPGAIVAHMLATGRGAAVAECPTGDWVTRGVEGTLPTVDGGTRNVRWSGYRHPAWAAAARQVNRADLEQNLERARPRLATGVPVLVVAAEPCGLPLAEMPERLPEGIERVVEAVRGLFCLDCQNVKTPGLEKVSTGRRCTEHRFSSSSSGYSSTRSAGRNSPPADASATGQPSTGNGVPVAMEAIRARLGSTPERTARQWLADAVARGLLTRTGSGRWTRYGIPVPGQVSEMPPPAPVVVGQADELPPADLERANGMLLEAAAEAREPRPRRSSRTTPNAPTEPRRGWPSTRPATPRTVPVPAVLAALGRARDELRARPEWNDPATWATVRGIIPPDAARAEVERMDAGLPPGVPVVRRE